MPKYTLAVIEAGRGSASAFKELHDSGEFYILFVTRTPVPDTIQCFADEIFVVDTNDKTATIEALRCYAELHPIDGAITLLEWYVPMTEAVRVALGLPGNGEQVGQTCRDKNLMREKLCEYGIPIPRFSNVETSGNLLAAVEQVGGFPCVLKPADGTGSTNVVLVESEVQLRSGFEAIECVTTNSRGQRLSCRALVEEFVDGPEYAVDSLSVDGEHVVVAINQYTMCALPYLTETGFFTPPTLSSADRDVVMKLASHALDAVGITTGASHCEVKWGTDGPVVIEIAARFGGAHLPELIPHTTGIGYYLEGAKIACGARALPVVEQCAAGVLQHIYAHSKGRLTSINGFDELKNLPGYIAAYENAVGSNVTPEIRDYTAAVGDLLFCASTAAQAMARVEDALSSLGLVIDEDLT
jgi:S-sulfo-L-cysteine synthase (3-phospho-L-serine-dependent)